MPNESCKSWALAPAARTCSAASSQPTTTTARAGGGGSGALAGGSQRPCPPGGTGSVWGWCCCSPARIVLGSSTARTWGEPGTPCGEERHQQDGVTAMVLTSPDSPVGGAEGTHPEGPD